MIDAFWRSPARGLACLLLLAACQSTSAGNGEPELTPLAGPALHEVLTTNTLARSGGTLWQAWEYAGLHRGDGSMTGGDMTGRVAWSGEEQVGHGTWELTPDGLYCRTWENEWGGGKRGCFRVAGAPQTIVFDYVSGSRGDAERYIYRLVPGNPYGL